jgi:phospholipase C
MSDNSARRSGFRARLSVSAAALSILGFAAPALAADPSVDTATPIKHVIVIIGENWSFDSVFGAYEPQPGQPITAARSTPMSRSSRSGSPIAPSAILFNTPLRS